MSLAGRVARAILPRAAQDLLRAAASRVRSKEYYRRVLSGEGVGEKEIVSTLRSLGIREGDDVLVHASMKKIGVVQGGSKRAVAALLKAIGPEGTLLAPAYPMGGAMLEHLSAPGVRLDANHSPSTMGGISEAVRTWPGARRSLHPTHSVAAVGKRAAEYVEGHERAGSPCGKPSPFTKLIERRGWILSFGSPIGKVTSYHVIEDQVPDFPQPVYLEQEFEVEVIDEGGVTRQVRTKCHNPELRATRVDSFAPKEAEIEKLLLQAGVLHQRKLGAGMVSAMRADLFNEELLRLLARGITIYTPPTV